MRLVVRPPVLLAMLAVLAACGAAPPRDRAADPEALVACWRDAMGGAARLAAIRSIEREGTIAADGLAGALHTWSRADGALHQDTTLGPASEVTVFDGAYGWRRSGFGAPIELARSQLARVRTEAYLEALTPLVAGQAPGRPGRMPGRIDRGPRPGSLVIAAESGRPVTIVLAPQTCLPVALEESGDGVTTTVRWPRWITVDGVRLPAAASIETSQGDTQRIEYTATRIDAPLPPAVFDRPGTDPRAHVPPLAAPLVLPTELTQNHTYVEARINGRGPIALLVDTGDGGLLLDGEHGRALGLTGEGSTPVRGAGAGHLEAQVVAQPRVELGGAEFVVESAQLTPLGALAHHEGRPIGGILGYEVIGHYVAEFDYATPALRLHDPATFQPPADAVALPLYLHDTEPMIEASFELADGRRFAVQALVDTGNRGAWIISSAFVARHHLLAGAGPVLRAPLGFGVGGQTLQALGRVAAVHLGPIVVRDVLAAFSEDTHGSNASDESVQVNLGAALLRQFTVWFDYPHQRLYLRPNARFGEPIDYDASGLSLEAPDEAFRRIVVRSVLPGSPGAAVGIERGDELNALDGEPASALGLEAIRARLRAPGRRIRIELSRGGQPRTVELATRRLI